MSFIFEWEIYRELNPDLVGKLKTPRDFYQHFVHHGRPEGRPWNIYISYPQFKWYDYKWLNPDLAHMSKHALEMHWLRHGRHEGRPVVMKNDNDEHGRHEGRPVVMKNDDEHGRHEGRSVVMKNDNDEHGRHEGRSVVMKNDDEHGRHEGRPVVKKNDDEHGRHKGRPENDNTNHVNVITFIIPSLNRPTLSRTIDSLLAQTDPHWQCIIVYDGCEGAQFADKRIQTVFLSKRQGKSIMSREDGREHGQAGRVRNFGLKLCRTPWIGFVDDDDTLDENYVHFLFTRYAPIYDVVVWRMTYSDGNVLPPVGCQKLQVGLVGISFCFRNIFDTYFANNAWCEDFNFLKKLLQQTPRQRVVLTKEVFYYVGHEKPTQADAAAAAAAAPVVFAFS